ncbi:hypothetical protein, variant 2 [Phytophthora nicotianae P10297]|uniref:Peroxin domain-containing protein n=1 Tax=Phytophthora nicotianae P10297 TaxID=1317064 RepID=W2ZFZ2_PHYNI|nr:hypothetical protein, variant 2 [Phytophthora nicotianae P10297]
MISRLRLGGSGGNNNNGGATTTSSIFGAAASAMSSISSGGSLLPGNSSVESAAATAAANHAASSGAAGALGAAGLDTPNSGKAAGGGFFGVSRMVALVNQANRSLQTSLQSTTAAPGGKSGTQSRGSGQDVDRDGQVVVEIFENERLEGKLQPMDPKRFSDRHAAPGAGQDEKPEGDLPAGHEWVTDWEIDQNYTAVDRDGWTYAADFVEIVRLLGDDLSHASRHPTDAVRRRRWIRYRQPVDENTPQSPTDSTGSKSLASSATSNNWGDSTNGQGNDYMLGDNDDPFMRTAQKTQTGFRVNVNFAHRGKKDNTKDYQSISLTDVMWLVNAHDVTNAPTEELMREKTANLEEQIKEATLRSKSLEKELRSQHDKQTRELTMQQKKFDALVAQYRKIQTENETLQASVSEHRVTVEALRKEAVRSGTRACSRVCGPLMWILLCYVGNSYRLKKICWRMKNNELLMPKQQLKTRRLRRRPKLSLLRVCVTSVTINNLLRQSRTRRSDWSNTRLRPIWTRTTLLLRTSKLKWTRCDSCTRSWRQCASTVSSSRRRARHYLTKW